MKQSNNALNRFRIISFIEGLSYIVLIFVIMPLKYLYDSPELMKIVGMTHGVLFMLFVIFLVDYMKKNNIRKQIGFDYFIYSLIPFGFFLIENLLQKKQKKV